MEHKQIVIKGAKEHNLKNVNIDMPRDQLIDFAKEMTDAGVDWQLTSYGGAVHSFTDPNAQVAGKMQYDAKVARRAFQAMYDLLDERFGE